MARSFGSIASSLYSSTSTLSRQSLLPQTHIEPSSPSNAGIKNKKNYRVRHNYQIVPALSGNIYSMFFFKALEITKIIPTEINVYVKPEHAHLIIEKAEAS